MDRASKALGTDAKSLIEDTARRSRGMVVIALDGTGSMAQLIDMTRDSICEIVNRVRREGDVPAFRLYIYRDYDVVVADRANLLLETSEPFREGDALRRWLDGKTVGGGGGNDGEAVEVALQHILDRSEASVVMIAGDEPANSRKHIDQVGGGQYRTAMEIASDLGRRGVPVHAFTVGLRGSTRQSFKQIAAASGGKVGKLDGGAEMIDLAVVAILKALHGDAAVRRYTERGLFA